MGKPPKLPNDWEEVHYTHLFIPEEEFSGITKMSLDDVQKKMGLYCIGLLLHGVDARAAYLCCLI